MRKQIFLSHAWAKDAEGRDTHARARRLARALQNRGWETWFDDDDMADETGNVDAAMVSGIQGCVVFVPLLTSAYVQRVNEASINPRVRRNCKKEWDFANVACKVMLPVNFEPSLSHTQNQGVISLYTGSTLHVEGGGDDVEETASRLHTRLRRMGMEPRRRRLTPTVRTVFKC